MTRLPYPEPFRTAVHGTLFAERRSVLERLVAGDPLILVPDPPGAGAPAVWVHAKGGDVLGHLPPSVAAWLAPWMLAGGRCGAVVFRVAGPEVPSWERLVVEVRCHPDQQAPGELR